MPIPNLPNTSCIEHQPRNYTKVGDDYYLTISCKYKLTRAQLEAFKAKLLAQQGPGDDVDHTTEIENIDQVLN